MSTKVKPCLDRENRKGRCIERQCCDIHGSNCIESRRCGNWAEGGRRKSRTARKSKKSRKSTTRKRSKSRKSNRRR